MKRRQHVLDLLDQGKCRRRTHQPHHRAWPTCLPNQLIDTIGQRVEIKGTST
jgi:hypothetical protein